MDNLFIEKKKDTLEVKSDVDKNILSMSGTSYPENAMKFFEPIFEYIENYLEEKEEMVLELRISYLNTSSTKCFINIFQILEDYLEKGCKVKVKWYYMEKDYNSQEVGEEFMEDLELPFELVSY